MLLGRQHVWVISELGHEPFHDWTGLRSSKAPALSSSSSGHPAPSGMFILETSWTDLLRPSTAATS